MKILKLIVIFALGTTAAISISGCTAANISSDMRASDMNSNMETRCVALDMRSDSEMNEVFRQYDGWRVFYISEYTTKNLLGTHGSVCFERQKRSIRQRR